MSRTALVGGAIMIALLVVGTRSAIATDKAAELSKNSQVALAALYSKVPAAKALEAKAQAILLFPKVTEAGLGIGGQHGDGTLLRSGKAVPYALFFMNAKALEQLDAAKGFGVGVGQKGLMGGLGIQGNNIRKIDPS